MSNEIKKFTIEVEMGERWIPHFIGMLKYMQHLGQIGSSRNVGIHADGDGDFRPKFTIPEEVSAEAEPKWKNDGNRMYDAG